MKKNIHICSIRWKIILLAGFCLLVALTSIVALSVYNADKTQSLVREQTSLHLRDSAIDYISTLASEKAEMVAAVLNKNYYRANSLATSISFMYGDAKKNGTPDRQLRTSLNQLIKKNVATYKDVLGIFVVLKPDFIGNDVDFIDDESTASNDTGRFDPYWSRGDDGELLLEVVPNADIIETKIDQSGFPDNEWFNCSLRTKKPCILNPYLDRVGTTKILMTSVTVPLFDGSEVIGSLGIDLSLASLQPLIKGADNDFVDGLGEILLVSQDGIIAAHDQGDSKLGKFVKDLSLNKKLKISAQIKKNTSRIEWDSQAKTLNALVPVLLEGVDAHWELVFSASENHILAHAIDLNMRVDKYNDDAIRLEIFGLIGIVFVSISLIWVMTSILVKPILELTNRIKSIVSGEWDLTQRLIVTSNDEVGELVESFNQFIEKLQYTVKHIGNAVKDTKLTSTRAAEIAGRTNSNSQQQFIGVEQAAAALEQMTSSVNLVAENANKATQSSEDAITAANKGQSVVKETTKAVEDLVEDVSAAMPMIDRLSQDSENINSILSVIGEIADQTNLLALNAAIEAARAGEHGRGFAVVATEVRNLAEKTQASINQTREVIEKLQSGTSEVVLVIRSGNDKAEGAIQKVAEMDNALSFIVENIHNIRDMGEQIANSVVEQSTVANEITRTVIGIKDASDEITQEASRSAEISVELQTLANDQQIIIDQFKYD